MKKILCILLAVGLLSSAKAQDNPNYFPVQLQSLQAGLLHGKPVLHWQTVCYVSHASFQVQKSYNGTDYNTIHTLTASKLRCQDPFEFVDDSPSPQGFVYYRVNAGDIDGNVFQSRTAKVLKTSAAQLPISVYPTVIQSRLRLQYHADKHEELEVRLVNSAGVPMARQRFWVQPGANTLFMNAAALSRGPYWANIRAGEGQQKSIAFIKN